MKTDPLINAKITVEFTAGALINEALLNKTHAGNIKALVQEIIDTDGIQELGAKDIAVLSVERINES